MTVKLRKKPRYPNQWPRLDSYAEAQSFTTTMPGCRGRPYTYRFNRDTVMIKSRPEDAEQKIIVEHLGRPLLIFTPDDVVTFVRVEYCVKRRFTQLTMFSVVSRKYRLNIARSYRTDLPSNCLAQPGTKIHMRTGKVLHGWVRTPRVVDTGKRSAWVAEIKKFNKLLGIAQKLGAFDDCSRVAEYDPLKLHAPLTAADIVACVRSMGVAQGLALTHSISYLVPIDVCKRWGSLLRAQKDSIYKQLDILENGNDSVLITVSSEAVRGNPVSS